jgi:protein-S-isoprenylcysteine O-methyltransferase Ste14
MLLWIGLLPRIFFRPGRRNVQWWLNTVPFWISGSTLLAVLFGVLSPMAPGEPWLGVGLRVSAVGATVMAGALLARTLSTHERPLALWHQKNDDPQHLVTDGPYAYVRHPLYSAFLVTLLGSALAAPHVLTIFGLAAAFVRLHGTAVKEESLFLRSPFGERYAAYVRSTGRFFPRLAGRSVPATPAGGFLGESE